MKKLTQIILLFLFVSFIACDQVKKAEIKTADGYLVETFEFIGDSIKHGLQTKFIGQKINEQAVYENGKLNGERKIFFGDGTPEIIEQYVNDVIHGSYKVYHPNGSIHIEAEYIEGKMQGELKRYYDSGEIMEEVVMKDNEENGPFKEYFKNGNLHWEGTFLNGDNEFGELKEYAENGELIKRMMCDSMSVCQTIWTKEKGDIAVKKYELSHELEQ